MNGRVADHGQRTAAHVQEVFLPVFDLVELWRGEIATLFETFAASGRPLTASVLDPLMHELASPALSAPQGLITGAGFVATPGVLADAPWHLAWWLREIRGLDRGDRGGIRRLEAVEDPESDEFRDYRMLEWWRVPERTGERHVTGPYVDYLCTDDYTITVTVPVVHAARMVGMVGVDVHVSRIEPILLPSLRDAEGTATIVNAQGRVVVSSETRRVTGSLLRDAEVHDALAVIHDGGRTSTVGGTTAISCGDTELILVQQR